jgi:hydrogenase/urease accessory protein HupE
VRCWLAHILPALLALLTFAAPARADVLQPGYLQLTQHDAQNWAMVWKAPIIGGLATRASPALPTFCSFTPGQPNLVSGALVSQSAVRCTRPLGGAQVGLKGIERSFTDALLRIAPLGQPVQTERLTRETPMVTVSTKPDRWQVARTYTVIGVEHILAGFDHLLFVVALVLLLQYGWTVVKAATAFTVAHSITLAGSSLGLFGLLQAPIEALIALSIVFLAVEIAKQADGAKRLSERIPWMVAFLFGLLHGFGFAGALREIGLPEGDVPMALFTFNVGVELGQLAIIAVTLAFLALLRRFALPALRPATVAMTYAIGGIASFWFIERVIG